MLTWATVWVLTVIFNDPYNDNARTYTYQLTYSSQSICERQRKYHRAENITTRCDFQQQLVNKVK